jgi:hypothetical protein
MFGRKARQALLACTLVVFTWSVASAGVVPERTYSWWMQGSDPGLTSLDVELVVTSEPSIAFHGVFYSHQWWLNDGTVGYIGLQNDGTDGKKAIFSVFNAVERDCAGDNRVWVDDGPSGYACRTIIHFNWQTGHRYRLHVWKIGSDGAWWGGAIIDDANVETRIGSVSVRAASAGIAAKSVTWVEYYASRASWCDQLGYSVVMFSPPTGTFAEGDTRASGRLNNHKGPGDCASDLYNVGGTGWHINGHH